MRAKLLEGPFLPSALAGTLRLCRPARLFCLPDAAHLCSLDHLTRRRDDLLRLPNISWWLMAGDDACECVCVCAVQLVIKHANVKEKMLCYNI